MERRREKLDVSALSAEIGCTPRITLQFFSALIYPRLVPGGEESNSSADLKTDESGKKIINILDYAKVYSFFKNWANKIKTPKTEKRLREKIKNATLVKKVANDLLANTIQAQANHGITAGQLVAAANTSATFAKRILSELANDGFVRVDNTKRSEPIYIKISLD